MKLRKQAGAKAAIVGIGVGLFFAFLSLIRADPRIKAEVEPAPGPAVDYQRFFGPATQAPQTEPAPTPVQRHTRTRAS